MKPAAAYTKDVGPTKLRLRAKLPIVPRRNLALPVISTAIVLLFGMFAFALWQSGLFTFTGTDASAKVVAAVAALVGGLIAAIVSLTGVLLKYAIDDRAETRQTLEAERNDILSKETATRLRLEAAIGAVQLFTTASSALSPPAQRAAALFMLAQLGQHNLSVSLVGELVMNGGISPSTAARILDAALMSGNAEIERDIVDILYDNASCFLAKDGFELPSSMFTGLQKHSEFFRDWAPMVMAKLLISKPCSEWRRLPYAVNTLVGGLMNAWSHEPVERIKTDTAAVLGALLPAFPNLPKILESRGGRLVVADVREQTKLSRPTSDGGNEMVTLITTWRET